MKRADKGKKISISKTRLLQVDQVMESKGQRRAESRQVEIAEISRSLKALAKDLGIPVVALSQLNQMFTS